MRNTDIKRKDIEEGEREYIIRVRIPNGANELPGKCGNLEDLIAMGILPIRELIDMLDEKWGGRPKFQTESVVIEQVRRLLQDLEDALYRYDKGVAWNVPPELQEIYEKIESIPKEKIPYFQGLIDTLVTGEKPKE